MSRLTPINTIYSPIPGGLSLDLPGVSFSGSPVYPATKAKVKSKDISGGDLPGMGDPCETGGRLRNVGGCASDKGHSTVEVRDKCHNRSCPKCWHTWAYRAVMGGLLPRMTAYRLLAHEGIPGMSQKPPKHTIFSPLQEWAIPLMSTKEGRRKVKKECVRVAKNAGLVSGVPIFHPYRTTKRADYEFMLAVKNHDPRADKGKWQYLRRLGVLADPDYVYLSPHVHIVGFGWIMHQADFQEQFPGWVYKNKGDLEGPGDIINCFMYLLSHADISTGHTVSYYGRLKTIKKEQVGRVPVMCECPECHKLQNEFYGWEVAGLDGYGQEIPDMSKAVPDLESHVYGVQKTYRLYIKKYPEKYVTMRDGPEGKPYRLDGRVDNGGHDNIEVEVIKGFTVDDERGREVDT